MSKLNYTVTYKNTEKFNALKYRFSDETIVDETI